MISTGLHSARGLIAWHGGPLPRPGQNGLTSQLGWPEPWPPPAWLAHSSAACTVRSDVVTAPRAVACLCPPHHEDYTERMSGGGGVLSARLGGENSPEHRGSVRARMSGSTTVLRVSGGAPMSQGSGGVVLRLSGPSRDMRGRLN
jgi:hypothetical protein